MNVDEAMSKVLTIFPDALFDERNGEVIIATGMALLANDELVSIEEAVLGSGYKDE